MPNPIRRRRMGSGSPFIPPQFSSLQLWLSADFGTYTDTGLTTPAVADATAIGGWADRGPLGHNATQGTGARQPVLKINIQNGKPSVLFTAASSQWMAVDAVSAAFTGSNLPITVVAVLKPVSTANQVYFALANNAVAAPNWFFDVGSGPVWAVAKHDDTTHTTTVSGGVPDTNPHITSCIGPGTTMTINVDGTVVANALTQNMSPTTFNDATVGALSSNGSQSIFLNSHLFEIFVWSTALSTGDQQAVRAAMAKKYGISST
jgi:hypothetical protein